MKLKSTFITRQIEGRQFMFSTDSDVFSGLIRSNKTAAFIVDCLKEETTKDEIVDALFAKYDAPRELIERDVTMVLAKLRSAGLLVE